MAKRKMLWIPTKSKAIKQKITDKQKEEVNTFFEPLIEQYKTELKKVKPSTQRNYVIDIYTKWYRYYFYFCQKYKVVFEERSVNEFEDKFVRLEFISENNFNFSYYRHTDQWHLVIENISLAECLEMMKGNSNFRPMF